MRGGLGTITLSPCLSARSRNSESSPDDVAKYDCTVLNPAAFTSPRALSKLIPFAAHFFSP